VRYDLEIRHRRSIRLKGYDYACDGEMILNDAGEMIQTVWDDLPTHYVGIETDAFIIMPNHIHGIIVIARPSDINIDHAVVGAGPRACPDYDDAPNPNYDGNIDHSNNSHLMMDTTGVQRTAGQQAGVQRTTGQPQGGCPYGGCGTHGEWRCSNGIVVAGYGTSVQIHDHPSIHPRRQTIRLAAIPRQIMATYIGTCRS